MKLHLLDEAATRRVGAALAATRPAAAVVLLHGNLGVGKTTLARGLLRALGHGGAVRSPTYTLLEPYELDGGAVYHLDLYRLGDPGELEYLGLRDLVDGEALFLIEWPDRGRGWLPPADLEVTLHHAGSARDIDLSAASAAGATWLEAVRQWLAAGESVAESRGRRPSPAGPGS